MKSKVIGVDIVALQCSTGNWKWGQITEKFGWWSIRWDLGVRLGC